MITYEKLEKKPRVFKSITGITFAEFEELYQKFSPQWERAERKRLNHSQRQRAIDAGHPYALGLYEMLLLTLV